MAPVFPSIPVIPRQFPGKHFICLHCSDPAYSDCTEGFGSSTLVDFENFLVFHFPF